MAKELYKKQQYRNAERRSLELLEEAQRHHDTYYQIIALKIAGNCQRSLGEYDTSLRSFEEILALPQSLYNEKDLQNWAYGRIGDVYYSTGQYKAAIEYWQKKVEILNELNDKLGLGITYHNLGTAHCALGDYKAAIECHQEYLEISVELNDKPGQVRAYYNLEKVYRLLGQYEATIEYRRKYFEISVKLGDEPEQRAVYCDVGNTYRELGGYKVAIECYRKHLETSVKLDDELGQGTGYCNIGAAHCDLGEYKVAIECFQKYLEITVELDYKVGQKRAYKNLGIACCGLGQYEAAIEYDRKHLEISVELDDKTGQRDAYRSLGVAHYRLGQYETAIECHRKHLQISVELDEKAEQARAYSNLGNAHRGLGEYGKAIEHHQKDLEISVEVDKKAGQMRAHGNLGLDYAESGQFDLACSHFASSDALAPQLKARLTDTQWRRHLLTFGKELALFMDWWVVAAARSGDMVEALRVEERRRCRPELAHQVDIAQSRLGVEADDDVSVDGLRAMASSAGASFVVVIKMYQGALLTWVLSGETGELVHTEIADVAGRESEIEEWVSCATFVDWGRWQTQLVEAQQSIEKKREEQGGAIPKSWLEREIETSIPADMKGDIDTKLWTSMRDPETFEGAITEADSPLWSELQKHFLKSAERAMDRLSELVWKPIVENCAQARRALESSSQCDRPIYFLPDPVFSPIPFAAFKVGQRFLIEKASVAQASSLRTLDCARARWSAICNKPPQPAESLVVSYEESTDPRQLLRDPFEALTKILDPTETLSESGALKEKVIERVARGSASLIHLLVHGTPVDRKKDWVGARLAGNEVPSAHELRERFAKEDTSTMSRLTRLLVLSGYSSDRGHRMDEGVRGFVQAGLAGGIPCVLAPKWNVPAKDSIILMTLIYASMAIKKDQYLTVAEAVQAAVVSLLEDEDTRYQKSFYYWAAFIPHGFANVKLDDALLNRIHTRLEKIQQESSGNEEDDSNRALVMAMSTLTRNAHHRLEKREQTLPRECYERGTLAASCDTAEINKAFRYMGLDDDVVFLSSIVM